MAKTKRKKRKYVKKNPEYWDRHTQRMRENSPLKKKRVSDERPEKGNRRGRKPLPQLFQLESGVPVPARTRLTEIRKTVKPLLQKMKIEQSFVINKGSVGTVRKIAKTEFPRKKFLTAAVPSGKGLMRVFRIK